MMRFLMMMMVTGTATAFVTTPPLSQRLAPVRAETEGGPLKFLSNIKKEIDALVDDAMMRKLGNGSGFYGSPKSNFYRKEGEENGEYAGPSGGSYFKLDRDGRPVTRKGNPIK